MARKAIQNVRKQSGAKEHLQQSERRNTAVYRAGESFRQGEQPRDDGRMEQRIARRKAKLELIILVGSVIHEVAGKGGDVAGQPAENQQRGQPEPPRVQRPNARGERNRRVWGGDDPVIHGIKEQRNALRDDMRIEQDGKDEWQGAVGTSAPSIPQRVAEGDHHGKKQPQRMRTHIQPTGGGDFAARAQ